MHRWERLGDSQGHKQLSGHTYLWLCLSDWIRLSELKSGFGLSCVAAIEAKVTTKKTGRFEVDRSSPTHYH